jgi:hypothetical protein
MTFHTSSRSFVEYYRCPEEYAKFEVYGSLSEDLGYFRFGADVMCYGRSSMGFRLPRPEGELYDSWLSTRANGEIRVPFEPDEIVSNLRLERYAAECRPDREWKGLNRLVSSAYYTLRPWLGVGIRKHLQRARLSGWQKNVFPHWPVDTTVDDCFGRLLSLAAERAAAPVPFVWFWPDGASSCALLTHDVEASAGYEFCPALMDIDEEFGFRASFQLVPESRYPVSSRFISEIKKRGFEVNVHDLNHDGHLFRDQQIFKARSASIKHYAVEFGAKGFRAGAMYRNPEWLETLGFEYDMSVPNCAHLDPQKGGCCTVMPYFIANTLELPTTVIQDYPLLHFIRRQTIDLWCEQVEMISRKHGLANFIVHPDYILEKAEQKLYRALLAHLKHLQETSDLWVPLPGEVNDWWRARQKMHLVRKDGSWHVEGPQSDRARVAYAEITDGVLTYQLQPVHA